MNQVNAHHMFIEYLKKLSDENSGFFVTPDIPKKLFAGSIKSYAKYLTSKGEKIVAVYDGGRSGKEGFVLTGRYFAYRDGYGNFGGSRYEAVTGFQQLSGGDPQAPFPIIKITTADSCDIRISFVDYPQTAGHLKKILRYVQKHFPPETGDPQNWRETLERRFPQASSAGLYKTPFIPDTAAQQAAENYGKGEVSFEDILVLFEYKSPGGEGFFFTDSAFYYNMGYENQGKTLLDTIASVGLEPEGKINKITLTPLQGRPVRLQFIIRPEAALILYEFFQKILNRKEEEPPQERRSEEDGQTGTPSFVSYPARPAHIRKRKVFSGRFLPCRLHTAALIFGAGALWIPIKTDMNILLYAVKLAALPLLALYGLTALFQRAPDYTTFLFSRFGKHSAQAEEAGTSVKIEGKTANALGVMEEGALMRIRKNRTDPAGKLTGREEALIESVPFYLYNDKDCILIGGENEMPGLFLSDRIAEDETLWVCGKIRKNENQKLFPYARFRLEEYRAFPEIPAALCDKKNLLGLPSFPLPLCIADLAASALCLAMAVWLAFMLFAVPVESGFSGTHLIFNLFR